MGKRLKDRPTTRASNEAQIAETISKRCLDINTISQDSLGCLKECIVFVVPLPPFHTSSSTFQQLIARAEY